MDNDGWQKNKVVFFEHFLSFLHLHEWILFSKFKYHYNIFILQKEMRAFMLIERKLSV